MLRLLIILDLECRTGVTITWRVMWTRFGTQLKLTLLCTISTGGDLDYPDVLCGRLSGLEPTRVQKQFGEGWKENDRPLPRMTREASN